MQRRQFLIGAGSAALGGSALLGSGAFTRVESHRSVTVQVAEDPSAYLGLAKCPESANGSYAWVDSEGHLEVLMNPDNPTIGATPLGEGVNSDSSTWFHSVFQLCNQGKEAVCVYIEDDPAWPTVPEGERDAGERRVEFYLRDDPERSLIGESNALVLPVGECVCVGLRTRTYGLSEGDTLLSALDNAVTITADVNLDCTGEGDLPGTQVQLAGDPVARDGDLLSTDPTNAKLRFQLENTGSTPVTIEGIRLEDTSSDAVRASAFWKEAFGEVNPVVEVGDDPAVETDGNPSVSLFFTNGSSFETLEDWPHPEAYPAEEFYPFDGDGSGDWGDPAMPGTVYGVAEQTVPAGGTAVVELGEFRLASVLTPNAVDMLGETVTLTLVLADGHEQQFELSIEDTWSLAASKTVHLLGLPAGELQLYDVPFSTAYEIRNNSFVGSDTLFATIEGVIDWDNGETTEFDIDPFGVATVAPDGNPGDDPGIEDTGEQTPAELVVENVQPVDTSVPETDFA